MSVCSTFHIMCAVPSIATFCSESIDWFPGTAANFFFKPFVTILVAQVTTGIITHFMFYIRYNSIHKFLHFILFSSPLLLLLLLLLLTL